MKKQLYKITPSDISMMVEQVVNEIGDTKKGSYILGALAGRADNKMADAVKRYNAGEEEKSFDDYKKGSQTYVDAKDKAKHKKSFEQGEFDYKSPKVVDWKKSANHIRECVVKALHEDFATDYNTAVDNKLSQGGMWGFEMKNPEGDWEYGDVKFDVNSMTMTCMNVTIQVDPDMTVDQNLEALYDKLLEAGYGDE